MYYYLYRFYDPNTQRWINRDPIQEHGSLNLYAFSGNNPSRRIDGFGLSFWDYFPVIGTIRGCLHASPGTNPADYAHLPLPSCEECKNDPEGAELKCRQRIALLQAQYNTDARAPGLFRGVIDAGAGIFGTVIGTRGAVVPGGILVGYAAVDIYCTFSDLFAIGDGGKAAADMCSCSKKK